MSIPTHGLVIRPHWLDHFFAGRKRWEIRSRHTQIRGPVALIASGSGQVVGLAHLDQVVGPLDAIAFAQAVERGDLTGAELAALGYPQAYGWVLSAIHRLNQPVAYRHPQGAVIWVRLPSEVQIQLKIPGQD